MESVDKNEEEVESDDDSDQGGAENQNGDQESVDDADQGSNGKKKGLGLSRATQDRAIAKAKKVLTTLHETFGVESVVTYIKPAVTGFNCKIEGIGENVIKYMESEEGKRFEKDMKKCSKQFERPDPNQHPGYKYILTNNKRFEQIKEECEAAKDRVRSKTTSKVKKVPKVRNATEASKKRDEGKKAWLNNKKAGERNEPPNDGNNLGKSEAEGMRDEEKKALEAAERNEPPDDGNNVMMEEERNDESNVEESDAEGRRDEEKKALKAAERNEPPDDGNNVMMEEERNDESNVEESDAEGRRDEEKKTLEAAESYESPHGGNNLEKSDAEKALEAAERNESPHDGNNMEKSDAEETDFFVDGNVLMQDLGPEVNAALTALFDQDGANQKDVAVVTIEVLPLPATSADGVNAHDESEGPGVKGKNSKKNDSIVIDDCKIADRTRSKKKVHAIGKPMPLVAKRPRRR